MKKLLLLIMCCCLYCQSNFAQQHQIARMLDASQHFYIQSSVTDNLGNLYLACHFGGTVDVDLSPNTTLNVTAAASTGQYDLLILKLDPGFNLIWYYKVGAGFAGFESKGIALDPNGGVVVGGLFFAGSPVDFNMSADTAYVAGHGVSIEAFLLKIDANGGFVWAKGIGSSGYEQVTNVAIDASRNVLATGTFDATVDFDPSVGISNLTAGGTNLDDVFVLKLNSSGNFVWVKSFTNTTSDDVGTAIATDAAKNVYISGYYSGALDINPGAPVQNIVSAGGFDGFVAKLDSNGNYITHFSIGSTGADKVFALTLGTAAEIHIGGSFNGTVDFDPSAATNNEVSTGGQDGFLAKYTSAGAYIWSTGLGSATSDACNDIAVDNANNVFVTGNVNSVPFIFKFNSAGNIQGIPGGVFGGYAILSNSSTVALAPWGDVYTCGYFYGGTLDFNPGAGTDSLTAGGNYNGFLEKQSNCQTASTPTIVASSNPLCAGNSDTLRIATGNLNGSGYWSWFTGSCGSTPAGTGFQIVVNPGSTTTYYVRGNSGCAPTNGSCGSLTITTNASVTPSVSIAANPGNNVCSGANVTFTATPTSGGASPQYQWRKNGTNIAGATNATYSTTTLANGDVISCVLTSNANCVTPTTATSSNITMTVNTVVVPSITIAGNPTTICAGAQVSFTSTISNGGNSPQFLWRKNGNTIAGATNSTYSTMGLVNGDEITCVLTSNALCATPVTDTSNTVMVTVNPIVTPSLTITATEDTICSGVSVTFTATPINGGVQPTFTWYRGSVSLGTPSTSNTYTSSSITSGAITCRMTSNASCITQSIDTSNVINLVVLNNLTPTISISQTPANNICSGATINFTSSVTNVGNTPQYQWKKNGLDINGATNGTFNSSSLVSGDVITCQLTSNYVCVTSNTATSNSLAQSIAQNVTPTVGIAASQTTICSGTSVTFTAIPVNGGNAPAYQWRLNGGNISGATNATYVSSALSNTDVISCLLTSNAICVTTNAATSNDVTMTVNSPVAPVVTISATQTTICSGNSVTFTATPTNGGNAPAYQWKLNGSNIGGATSVTYTTAALNNNDEISCVLASNASCISQTTDTSNTITITVSATVTPDITIGASVDSICPGQSVTFTATPSNGGATPGYQWKKNGSNIPGATSITYSTGNLVSTDVFRCQLTSSVGCASPNTALSNNVSVVLKSTFTPTVTVTANPSSICEGSSVSFSSNITGEGPSPSYQWKVNGNDVSGETAPTFTTNSLVNGDVVTLQLTSSDACSTPAVVSSVPAPLVINIPLTPSVSVSASQTVICSGATVQFTATITNGGVSPTYQWYINGNAVNGETTATFSTTSLLNNDVVACSVTSSETCVISAIASSNSITLTENSNVIAEVNISITGGSNTICSGTEVEFAATSVNGGAAPVYQWKLNNSNVGTNSSVYSSSTLADADVVKCEMTSNASCVQQPVVLSGDVQMAVNALPDVSITQSGDTLTVAAADIYQWMDCLNNTAISGEVLQQFVVSVTGDYKVAVQSTQGCADTSVCTNVTVVGIAEPKGSTISVKPNPFTENIFISLPNLEEEGANVKLFDAVGKLVLSEKLRSANHTLNINETASGIYLLRVTTGEKIWEKKLLKE